MREYRYTLTCNNDATSEVLAFSPDGWKSKGLTFKESKDYKAVLRSLTLDKLGFVADQKGFKGGKDFILSKYDTYGIQTDITVLIEKLNHQTWDFETYYTGILDFTNSPEQDDYFLRIEIADTNDQQRFTENDEVDVSLEPNEDLQRQCNKPRLNTNGNSNKSRIN